MKKIPATKLKKEEVEEIIAVIRNESNSKHAIQLKIEEWLNKIYDEGFCDGQESVLNR